MGFTYKIDKDANEPNRKLTKNQEEKITWTKEREKNKQTNKMYTEFNRINIKFPIY